MKCCRFWALQCFCIFTMPVKSACCQVIKFKLKERWWRKKVNVILGLGTAMVNLGQGNTKQNFQLRFYSRALWTTEKNAHSVSRMFNFQIYDYEAWIQYFVCCLQTTNSLWPFLLGLSIGNYRHMKLITPNRRNSDGFDSFLLSSSTIHKNSFTMRTQV